VNRVPVRLVVGAAAAPEGWVELRTRACPCCVGRVQMQVELARLIREERPRGVLIELAEASHLPALRRALAEWPLSSYVAL
jgi:hypothetical protein